MVTTQSKVSFVCRVVASGGAAGRVWRVEMRVKCRKPRKGTRASPALDLRPLPSARRLAGQVDYRLAEILLL